ncbi:MFS transporter [Terrisporobacter mayombei]|uniref:Transporter YycB n=1 Tax=Terrisporobacter mayombei TaxID=1541 RepID=A0ABY9Q579_9FIRM|nr:MFS transporter [Terrisporobacter mayombei]MCC3869365.1 MFS transporter [Terrisporobacter mayombei]WMT82195.1 putative transporter YycB [Terrisporobacter mayombei]
MNKKKILLTLTIIFISANLRGPLTMVGPLIPSMKESFTSGNSIFGILTSIPLFVFGLISIIAPKLDNKFGKRITITTSLILLLIGLIIRSLGSVSNLFIGSILVALGIGISNVLLPSVIVEGAPQKDVGRLTGTFTTTMGLFGSIASGLSIFLASIVGWQFALEFFVITVIIALALWLTYSKTVEEIEKEEQLEPEIKLSYLLKSKLVSAIALFMGLQSWIAYALFAWVPSILIDRGMSSNFSALALMIIQLCSMPTMYIIPIIAGKKKTQSMFVAVTTIISFIGCLSLFATNPIILTLGLVLIGIGQGASLSFSYLFFTVRTNSAKETSSLSGLSQTIGYFIASTGPILFGYIHDITNFWSSSLIFMLFIHVILLFAGILSGRNKKI